jgi:protein arginine kinase
VTFDDLVTNSCEWLKGTGPNSDIVVSSRVRLARNLADYPFVLRATDNDRAEIERLVRERLAVLSDGDRFDAKLMYVDVGQLNEIDRSFLMERQLISRELCDGRGARAVAIDPSERFSVMVNEEDHLRLQVMHSGLDLEDALAQADHLDDLIEEQLNYAFSDRFGYLTACPTNVGTGIRVSVMLHLSALVMTKQIEKVFRSLQKINLAVRGLYGEGSEAKGDFYQISNQVTLGMSEQELCKKVADVVPVLIDYERQARDYLLRESQEQLHDRVSRAFGILKSAQTISSDETFFHLSSLRMGVNLGLISQVDINTVNKLFIHTQPAHLQKIAGCDLDASDRNVERARYLRTHLDQGATSGGTSK